MGEEKKKNNIMLFILATHIVASRPPKCRSKIQNTRVGLQCQTPLRSYPLSLVHYPFIPYILSLIPYTLSPISTPCSISPSTVPFTKFRWGLLLSLLSLLLSLLSKPQLNHNHNSTQPNITLSWVRHENDFAHHHPTPPPTPHRNSMCVIFQLLLTRF